MMNKLQSLLIALLTCFSHAYGQNQISAGEVPTGPVIVAKMPSWAPVTVQARLSTIFRYEQMRSTARINNMHHDTKVEDEIKALLKKLIPKKTHTGSATTITGPGLEIQREVPKRLLEIASESAESRATVIQELIKVLDNPKAKKEFGIAHQWLTSVDVLGRLRATEAIDVLMKNIDETDPRLTIIYVFHGPVVVALFQIGEPAVPTLVKALSDKKASVRRESAYTLGLIGGTAAEGALRKALKKEKNKDVVHFIKAALPTEGPRLMPATAPERPDG